VTWALVTRTSAGVTDYLVEWQGKDYHGHDDRIAAVCPTREAALAALRLIDDAVRPDAGGEKP
jgi:hypothetical protein